MASTAARMRAYTGPALLSFGIRPLFLAAALWAAMAMALWAAAFSAGVAIPGRLSAAEWHMHELVFGYAPAVVAGFLLTAVPNWTGRLPVVGWPLAVLVAVWSVGRASMLLSASMPVVLAASIDLAFLAGLALVIAREIVVGRNWRNLKVLILVGLLFAGNLVFHLEAANGGALGGRGIRIGVGTLILMIVLIGGRLIPSFTRNWLARRAAGPLPTPFNRFDAVAVGAAAGSIGLWVLLPGSVATGWLCLASGVLHLARLARWAGWRTLAEPLVTILHVGYAFVPAGFLIIGARILSPGGVAGEIPHAWTAGAVATMTLAVMTRTSLGHAGRPLAANPATVAIYGAVLLAAVLRIVAEVAPGVGWMLHGSAAAWVAAYCGFAVAYWPMLGRRK
nr:NnrS protein involved in response to NO [uncultured bacterium]